MLTNTFDKLGRLTKANLNTNSNIETTYTYLASGYEGDYTTNLVETETNGVFSYKYEYDANGNITKVYCKNGDTYAVLEEYTYNELNELTQVDYLASNTRYTYSYDSGGNISKEKVYTLNNGTPTYQSSKNYVYGDFNWHDKLTSYGGYAITYDAIGNPLSYRGMTLTWQNGRQLASSSDGSTVTNYTYGADGMRMTKKVGSSTTYYQYFNGLLIQEIKGTKILDYSYDANGQIYAVRYRTNANDEGTYYYYAHNTRGDIIGLYNASGSLVAKYTYDIWGNPLSVTNASNAAITSQTDIANLQSFRYRGYYYDSNSGFYYLQSRYYDPVTHRFLNADGLVSTGTGVLGYNMFAYCENNPVNCFDCDGFSPVIRDMQERLASRKKRNFSILDVTRLQKEAERNTTKNLFYNHTDISRNGSSISAAIHFNEYPNWYDSYGIEQRAAKELIELISKEFYDISDGAIKLGHDQCAQLWGEIILHNDGYESRYLFGFLGISWDSLYEHCETCDLDVSENGCVDDLHSGALGTAINSFSYTYGMFSYDLF